MSETRLLLRTNPRLTTNYKLTIAENGIYLNSIDAHESLANDKFKDFKTSQDSELGKDLFSFWNRGKSPSLFLYSHKQNSSDLKTIKDVSLQYEKDYFYGAERCVSPSIKERMKIFAPLWIGNRLPKKFIIFKRTGARSYTYEKNPVIIDGVQYKVIGTTGTFSYNNISISSGVNFIGVEGVEPISSGDFYYQLDDINYENSINNYKNLIKESEILKVFNLDTSPVGTYLKKINSNSFFKESPISVNFKEGTIEYTGFDLDSGVLSSREETFIPALRELVTVTQFDSYVSDGFKRNRLASCNMINLEFCFDDEEEMVYNRYYGMYCDDLDTAEFSFDKDYFFGTLYPDKTYNPNFIPYSYSKELIDESGIKIPIKEKISGHIAPNDGFYLNDLSYHYVKFKENIFKLDNKVGKVLTLNDNKVTLNQIFGFKQNIEFVSSKLKKGKSHFLFHVDSEFVFSEKIDILKDDKLKYRVIADHLPNYTEPYSAGDSVAIYFYPNGTLSQIAKAIAKALNYVFKEDNVLNAYSSDEYVIIEGEYDGTLLDGLILDYPSNRITTINDEYGGGSKTPKNRIRIPFDSTNINDSMFISSDNGYSKIAGIFPYLDEKLLLPTGEVAYENYLNYKTLLSTTPNEQIKIRNNRSSIVEEDTLNIGVLSFYDMVDIDGNTESLEYKKAYYNEYKKYFNCEKLSPTKDGGFNFTLNVKGLTGDNLTIDYFDGFVNNPITSYLRSPGEVLDDILANIIANTNSTTMIHGFVASLSRDYHTIRFDFTGNLGSLTNTWIPVIGVTGYIEYSVDEHFNGGRDADSYTVFKSNRGSVAIEHNNVVFVEGNTFTAVNDSYKIISGNPVIINTKFQFDEEILNSFGFNTLTSTSASVEGLSLEKRYAILKQNSDNEYSLYRENALRENILNNKIWQTFNKWVLGNGKDVRNNPYRLNANLSFNEYGFSPSFLDKIPNASYFSHEWYYISKMPETITLDDAKNSDSYFESYFKEDLYYDKVVDYFKRYFTVSSILDQKVGLQKRYTTIENNNDIFETFFRGIKMNFSNADGKDYSNYKFSCLLQFLEYEQEDTSLPFEIKIIENDDFQNIVMLITIRIEDYKVTPFGDGTMFAEYMSLYMIKSLKEWNGSGYDYGRKYYYPIISGVSLPTPSVPYRGVKIPIIAKPLNNIDPDILEFQGKYFQIEELLKENSDDDFGTLFGYNTVDSSAIFTTGNSALPSSYAIDSTDKRILDTIGNNVYLKPNGLYVTVFTGFSYFANISPLPFYSLYDLSRVKWFQINGGKDYYRDLVTYASFAKIKELVEQSHPLVSSYSIKDGITNQSTIKIGFGSPDEFRLNSFGALSNEYANFEEQFGVTIDYPALTVGATRRASRIFRYSGDYEPKFIPVVKFKNTILEKYWSLYNYTWNESSQYTWGDFLDDTTDYEEIFDLTYVNTEIDEFSSKSVVEMFYHKYSKDNILLLDNPIYPEIDEIAIGSHNHHVLKNNFDRDYYHQNIDKKVVELIAGCRSSSEEKSFLATSLVNIPNLIKTTVTEFTIGRSITFNPNLEAKITSNKSSHIIKIDLKKLFRNFFFDTIKAETLKYVNESNLDVDIDTFVELYILNNFYEVYELKEVEIYKKDTNEVELTINTQIDPNILLKEGYKKEKEVKTTLLGDTLSIEILKNREFGQSINIKTNFNYK